MACVEVGGRGFVIRILYEFPVRWEDACGDIRVEDLANGKRLSAVHVVLSNWVEIPLGPWEMSRGILQNRWKCSSKVYTRSGRHEKVYMRRWKTIGKEGMVLFK